MTKLERQHLSQVAAIGCLICKLKGLGTTPAEVHHIHYAAGKRASHYETIPLCTYHHRSGPFGEAIHNGGKTFQEKYGTEAELLAETLRRLKYAGNESERQG